MLNRDGCCDIGELSSLNNGSCDRLGNHKSQLGAYGELSTRDCPAGVLRLPHSHDGCGWTQPYSIVHMHQLKYYSSDLKSGKNVRIR